MFEALTVKACLAKLGMTGRDIDIAEIMKEKLIEIIRDRLDRKAKQN